MRSKESPSRRETRRHGTTDKPAAGSVARTNSCSGSMLRSGLRETLRSLSVTTRDSPEGRARVRDKLGVTHREWRSGYVLVNQASRHDPSAPITLRICVSLVSLIAPCHTLTLLAWRAHSSRRHPVGCTLAGVHVQLGRCTGRQPAPRESQVRYAFACGLPRLSGRPLGGARHLAAR